MSPEALIFDLDGTLWDSTETCMEAWAGAIAEFDGVPPVTREQMWEAYGLGRFFEDYESAGRSGLSKAENIHLIIARNQIRSAVYDWRHQRGPKRIQDRWHPVYLRRLRIRDGRKPRFHRRFPL